MKYILQSNVFDEAITSKIEINNNDFVAGMVYNLDVIFHVKRLSDPRFQIDNLHTKDTLDRDYINEILDSKLESIEQFFASHGFKIMRSAIMGDNQESTEIIIIKISEMPAEVVPTKSGENSPPLKVRSIIPSKPYINEVAVRAFAPVVFKELKAEMSKSTGL